MIFLCRECTFAFAHPFVGGDEEFYDILHEQQGYPKSRWDFDVAIRTAVSPRAAGRILDIGAGTGAFLSAVDGAWDKYATEGGESTRTQLEGLGIRVCRDLAELVERHAGQFDVITMFQFLEHISDFRTLLIQVARLLKADGKLVITVPHGEAMLRQERVLGCPDMPPFHVSKWTPQSLSRVLQQVGFRDYSAIPTPPRWRDLLGAMHLRVLADAATPGTMAAQAYRIKRKSLRIPVLGVLGIPAFARVLPHIRELRMPGAFAMVASLK